MGKKKVIVKRGIPICPVCGSADTRYRTKIDRLWCRRCGALFLWDKKQGLYREVFENE